MGTITGRALATVFGILFLVLGPLFALDPSFHVLTSIRSEAFLPGLPPAGEIGLGLVCTMVGVLLLLFVSREVTESHSVGLVVAGVIVVATVTAVLVSQRVPHTKNFSAPPLTAAQAAYLVPRYADPTALLEEPDVLRAPHTTSHESSRISAMAGERRCWHAAHRLRA